MALKMVKTANLPIRRRARWLYKLQQYNFTIQYHHEKRIPHADAFSRLPNESNQALANILIKVLKREIERRNFPIPKAKFITVIVYNKQGVYLYYRIKGEMAELWQSVCEKTKSQDLTLRDIVLRELEEETGLVVIQEDLQFLFNDNNFDCDIYKLKVHSKTKLD